MMWAALVGAWLTDVLAQLAWNVEHEADAEEYFRSTVNMKIAGVFYWSASLRRPANPPRLNAHTRTLLRVSLCILSAHVGLYPSLSLSSSTPFASISRLRCLSPQPDIVDHGKQFSTVEVWRGPIDSGAILIHTLFVLKASVHWRSRFIIFIILEGIFVVVTQAGTAQSQMFNPFTLWLFVFKVLWIRISLNPGHVLCCYGVILKGLRFLWPTGSCSRCRKREKYKRFLLTQTTHQEEIVPPRFLNKTEASAVQQEVTSWLGGAGLSSK